MLRAEQASWRRRWAGARGQAEIEPPGFPPRQDCSDWAQGSILLHTPVSLPTWGTDAFPLLAVLLVVLCLCAMEESGRVASLLPLF